MSTLTVQRIKESPQKWVFQVWCKAEHEVQFRPDFYAVDPSGKTVIVTLEPAAPTPGYLKRNPFSLTPPLSIEPVRLVHAPFFASKQDATERYWEQWETESFRLHGKTFILTPEDDEPLKALLEKSKAAAAKDMAAEMEAIKGIDDNVKKKEMLKNLKHHYLAPRKRIFRERNIFGAGLLNLELADIKDPNSAICGTYMLEAWCKLHEISVAAYYAERDRFKTWMATFAASTLFNVKDMRTRTQYQEYGLDLNELGWETIMARTLYRITFEDASIGYLADFKVRKPSTVEEWAEIKELKDQGVFPEIPIRFRTNEDFTHFEELSGRVPKTEFYEGNMPKVLRALYEARKKGTGRPEDGWMTWGELRNIANKRHDTVLKVMSPEKLFHRHNIFFNAAMQTFRDRGVFQEGDSIRVRLNPDVIFDIVPTPPKIKGKRGPKPRAKAQLPPELDGKP